jgi:hypothetical protein
MEVVVMSKSNSPSAQRACQQSGVLGLVMATACLTGCASVSQDVDAYYRQMAYNYKVAEEKAKVDASAVERESKTYATMGEFGKYRRAQREAERLKSWEAKCEREAKRFEKAAEWTEAHFHVERPPIPAEPPGYRADNDSAVMQASGIKDP